MQFSEIKLYKIQNSLALIDTFYEQAKATLDEVSPVSGNTELQDEDATRIIELLQSVAAEASYLSQMLSPGLPPGVMSSEVPFNQEDN